MSDNNFETLLGQLEAVQTGADTMVKALAADAEADKAGDKKIAAAAADGAKDGDGDDTLAGGKDGDGDGDAMFGKSFQVTLEDGSVQEAFDGTAMMKALGDEVVALKGERDSFGKALGIIAGTMKAQQGLLSQQADMLKSLQGDIATLRGSGTGRRALLSVHEKPAGTPPPNGDKPTMSRTAFMAKALVAHGKGLVTADEVAGAEHRLNIGRELPDDFVTRVRSA